MRYITKNKSRAPNFESWKIAHQSTLNAKFGTITPNEIWKWFGENYPVEKSELRIALLKDQGYICCYCGQRIDNIPTAIEHFHPKSIYTNEMFDYENLLISCKCSALASPPSIKFKQTIGYENLDTIDQISQKSGCSKKKIRKSNPVLAGKNPTHIITELSVGDDLFLHIKHCDDKKDSTDVKDLTKEIINPSIATGCAGLFFYDSTGRMTLKGVSHIVEKNLLDEILCLNAPPLQIERAQAYNAAQMLRDRLIQELSMGNITELELLEEISSQEEPDADGKLASFCFVYTFVLSTLIG